MKKDADMSTTPDIDMGTPARHSDQTVDLTIDGHAVRVPQGTSLMRAAAQVGIDYADLCWRVLEQTLPEARA